MVDESLILSIDKQLAQLETILSSTNIILTILEKSSRHSKLISTSLIEFKKTINSTPTLTPDYNSLLQRFLTCYERITSISLAATLNELDWKSELIPIENTTQPIIIFPEEKMLQTTPSPPTTPTTPTTSAPSTPTPPKRSLSRKRLEKSRTSHHHSTTKRSKTEILLNAKEKIGPVNKTPTNTITPKEVPNSMNALFSTTGRKKVEKPDERTIRRENTGITRENTGFNLSLKEGNTLSDLFFKSKSPGFATVRLRGTKNKLDIVTDIGPPAPSYIPRPPERFVSDGLSDVPENEIPPNTPVSPSNNNNNYKEIITIPSLSLESSSPSSPSSVLDSIREFSKKIYLKILIPFLGATYYAYYTSDMTFTQVKLDILKKIKRAGVKYINCSAYHICIRGLQIFDERVTFEQILVREEDHQLGHRNQPIQIEVKRQLDFEINLLDIPLENPIIVTENMDVRTVIDKISSVAFPNMIDPTKTFNYYLIGSRFKSPEKLDFLQPFISYGFRKEDKLKIVAESVVESGTVTPKNILEEQLIIQYSPFDSIDKQKFMLSRDKSGYLRKQGGSKGGNKASWKKRWIEFDNNCLVYYTDRKAKSPQGLVNLTNFVTIQEVTDQRKVDNQFYFSVTTSERSGQVLFCTTTEKDMHHWISSIRQYCNLLRIEQAYNVKVNTLEDRLMTEGNLLNHKRRKKDDVNAAAGSISEPFLARKLFSISADWEWNSNQNPSEVFGFIELIGVGACGKVFKAVHKQMNFELAIKVIKQENDLQEILEKEIQILKKCRNETVIAYYGTVLRGNDTWILMEYCAVGSVKDVMNVLSEPLNEIQCCYVINRTLRGLNYMHSKNILHLDIKAANILITVQGIIKLADFGVSQFIKSKEITKNQEDYVGSPLYMAPEILQKQGYNSKADIWSLGITIIEMMEERPPNTDINTLEMLPLLLERPQPTLKPTTKASGEFRKFLSKVFVKDPLQRLSAEELLNDPVVLFVVGPECLSSRIQMCLSLQVSKRKKFTLDMLL